MKFKLAVVVIGLLCVALVGTSVFAFNQTARVKEIEAEELRKTEYVAISHISEWVTAAKDCDEYKFYALSIDMAKEWAGGCIICRLRHSYPTEQEGVRKTASWEEVVEWFRIKDAPILKTLPAS